MVEQATEKVEVTLIDGSRQEIVLKKYLPFRVKQQLQNKLTEGVKLSGKTKADEVEIDAVKASSIVLELAEAIWEDKNISLDDVESESLSEVIIERFDRFLGGAGFKAEKQS